LQHLPSRPRTLATRLSSLVTLALMAWGSTAHAGPGAGGAVVVFGPATTSVPTLSEAMLLVLTLLVAVVAWRGMRDKAIGKPLASLVLAGILMLGVGSGGLLRPALADPGLNIDGGMFTWTPTTVDFDNQITNAGAKPAQVISVTYTLGAVAATPLTGTQCTVGLVLAHGASCTVRFSDNT
jgi:hypothetical protein